MAEFARVTKAAIAKYEKGASNETIDNSILLSMLQEKGRIKYNWSGTSFEKRMRVSQATLQAMTDMEPITFARENPYEETTLPWREYRMQVTISDKEKEMCKGNEMLIDIWANRVQDIKDDFKDLFSAELYIDGNATGNTARWHGLESIFGATGSCGAGTNWESCSESYAGLTLAGAHGDSPKVTAAAYSPKLLNEVSTAIDPNSYTTYASAPIERWRRLISACTIRNNKTDRPDLGITTESRYIDLLNKLQAEERIMAAQEKRYYAGAVGVEVDGIPIMWDADCSSSRGYCLNLDKMEVRMLKKQFVAMRTDFDIRQNAHLTVIYAYGNLWIHPRYQGKMASFV
jgi:hypothetical protein